MKIKEVENQTGITSHNIRFYEKEHLIFPQRNPMNGYREYTDADVKLLNRIKLLRILDISVSEIRDCIQGRKNLSDVLRIHMDDLKTEEQRIRQNQLLCEQLADLEFDINEVPDNLLEQIFHNKEAYCRQLEQLKKQDRIKSLIFLSRQSVCILGWLFVMILCLYFYFELFTAYMTLPFQLIALSMITVVFVCMIRTIYYNEKA